MPTEHTHTASGPADRAEVSKLANAVEDALTEALQTFYRDDTEPPAIGPTPPVPQPGRPPMSEGATDASVLMLAGGASVSMVGLTAAVVMYASQYADPTVCALVFSAPTALVLALARLMKRTKETVQAAPAEHHHHYRGPVRQEHRHVHNENRGFGRSTTNL